MTVLEAKKKGKKEKKKAFLFIIIKKNSPFLLSLSLSLGLVAKVLRRRRRKTFRISAAFFARGCSFGCVGWLLKKFITVDEAEDYFYSGDFCL